jgi:hypothetical protein
MLKFLAGEFYLISKLGPDNECVGFLQDFLAGCEFWRRAILPREYRRPDSNARWQKCDRPNRAFKVYVAALLSQKHLSSSNVMAV